MFTKHDSGANGTLWLWELQCGTNSMQQIAGRLRKRPADIGDNAWEAVKSRTDFHDYLSRLESTRRKLGELAGNQLIIMPIDDKEALPIAEGKLHSIQLAKGCFELMTIQGLVDIQYCKTRPEPDPDQALMVMPTIRLQTDVDYYPRPTRIPSLPHAEITTIPTRLIVDMNSIDDFDDLEIT